MCLEALRKITKRIVIAGVHFLWSGLLFHFDDARHVIPVHLSCHSSAWRWNLIRTAHLPVSFLSTGHFYLRFSFTLARTEASPASFSLFFRLDRPGFEFRQGQEIVSSRGPPSLLFNGYLGSFPGVKRPAIEVNHSPSSSAEGKNGWSYTSAPPICFDGVNRDIFTLFNEIWYLSMFQKSVEEIQVSLKYDNNNGTSHEAVCTFMIISRSIRLRIRNVSDKSCRENQNTHFIP
jgi:hypothetical protein